MLLTENAAARFIAKLDIRGPDECWECSAGSTSGGYGQFKIDGEHFLAHRLAWVFWRGPIPEGMFVLHRCDNRPCCNPRHLWLGTQADNIADMMAKGRRFSTHGEQNGNAKLTAEQALNIRRRYADGGIYQRELAEEYDIGRENVGKIIRGERWHHVAN